MEEDRSPMETVRMARTRFLVSSSSDFQMLLFLIAQVGHEQVRDIARAADAGRGVLGEQREPVAELDGGLDLGGFDFAQALDAGELLHGGRGDAFDAAELGQQVLAERDGAALGRCRCG